MLLDFVAIRRGVLYGASATHLELTSALEAGVLQGLDD